MKLEETDELNLCDIPMNAREVAQIFSFAFSPDDVLYSLTRMSKTSLSFLSKNRVEIIEICRESDDKL